MKKVKERTIPDLLELTLQLHSRASSQPNNKEMHDAYVEAKQELEKRLSINGRDKQTLKYKIEIEFDIENNFIKSNTSFNGDPNAVISMSLLKQHYSTILKSIRKLLKNKGYIENSADFFNAANDLKMNDLTEKL